MPMIKIMSGEDRSDSDTSKSFYAILLGPGDQFTFERKNDVAQVTIQLITGVEHVHELTGNAYVVSDMGKTIATFAYSDIHFAKVQSSASPTYNPNDPQWASSSAEMQEMQTARLNWLKRNNPEHLDRVRLLIRPDGSLVINELVPTQADLDKLGVPQIV